MKKERLRVRQLLAVLALSMVMPVEALAQHFTVNYRQEPVAEVIKDLRQRTGYDFVYQKQVLDGVPAITCNCQGMSLAELLDCVFHSLAGLDYEVSGKTIVLRAGKGRNIAQPVRRLISGTVVDAQGEPLQWATIKVKGTSTGATTNENGIFQFYTDRRQETLEVSYLGFNSVTRTVQAGRPVRIIMHEDNKSLDEVVVTGYQVLDKRSLTSAVTSAKMKDLERTDMSSLDQMLEGKIPDLLVSNNSFEVGVAPKIRIRGTSTLIGNREPLWVVDGIVVQDPVEISPEELNDPDYINRIGNAIAGINPQDIERIDVLKDAAATAIYGTKAANGVIVITTKRGYEGKPVVSYNFSMNYKLRPRYTAAPST
jgi:TonB-dependent SusC/RagA subfamily outer membrane receptor